MTRDRECRWWGDVPFPSPQISCIPSKAEPDLSTRQEALYISGSPAPDLLNDGRKVLGEKQTIQENTAKNPTQHYDLHSIFFVLTVMRTLEMIVTAQCKYHCHCTGGLASNVPGNGELPPGGRHLDCGCACFGHGQGVKENKR